MNSRLLTELGITEGIVSAVGAGGKKSTLYAIAQAFHGRLAITSTVFITSFPRRLQARRVVADVASLESQVLEAASEHSRVAYALPSEKPGRSAGVPPDCVAELHRKGGFDLTLVKADGARMRRLKAPGEHEPALPPGTDKVLPILSVQAVGQPLDDNVAHRVDQVAAVTGARPGQTLTPEHLARLLASPEGALKGTQGLEVAPVINMVDDAQWQEVGREIAHLALAITDRFDRVALTALHATDPLVESVQR